jgi:lysozyme
MGLLVVDVSRYQGTSIDWSAVKAAGCVMVIQKATEGLTGLDSTLRKNLDDARSAGLYGAIYSFLRPSQGDPEAQVELAWNKMGEQMPSFLAEDLESAPADWSPARVLDFAERWATHAKAYFGRYPVFYSFDWFLQHQISLASSTILGQCPLWIAQPSWPKPGLPPSNMKPIVRPPWKSAILWQFSSDNSKNVPGTLVPGIPTVVDRNVFNGDIADLHTFLGLPTPDQLEPESPILHPLDYDFPGYADEDDPPFKA